MKTTSIAVALVALFTSVGCASAPSTPCAPRQGTYSAHFVERAGGTCGPMADQNFGIDPNLPDFAPVCTGGGTYTPDHCDETLNVICPSGNDGSLQSIGTVSWSDDAARGSATLRYTYRDSHLTVTCDSTYDITYIRL